MNKIQVTQPTFLINLDNPTETSYVPMEGNWKTITSQTYLNGFPEIKDDEILYIYKNNRGYIYKNNIGYIATSTNNEKYNQIIDDVYKSYIKSFFEGQLKENYISGGYDFDDYYTAIMDVQNFLGLPGPISQKEFINKIKTDGDFSKEWGLKIEERELSLEERTKYKKKRDGIVRTFASYTHQMLDGSNIPTKLIAISYNNETIESYEY
jgi:hypothetical protein